MGIALLLVEDNEHKREHVRAFVSEHFPALEIESAKSYQGALKKLLTKSFAIVLLDMTIPTFDKVAAEPAGSLRPLGGRDLLDQIYRKRVRTRVIVLTGYDILGEGTASTPLTRVEAELRSRYPDLFVAAIFYSRSEDSWKVELTQRLQRLVELESQG